MNTKGVNTGSSDLDPYYGSDTDIKWLVIRFTTFGVVVSILWLSIFVAGLLVDSSYYRSAISYRFAGPVDWILAIITFTFSNVVLLAFTSGLLGGITSKLLYTRGFKITVGKFKKANAYQIENPFISAFRGMFVFIAILFMQYVSTFSDLGAISKMPQEDQKVMTIQYETLYGKFAEKEKDTTILKSVRSEMDKLMASADITEPDTSAIRKIILLKASLRELSRIDSLTDTQLAQKRNMGTSLQALRRTLKVPPNSDFSGIGLTSISYFKFAVIVSFLAFAFGYDPSLFSDFLGKIFMKLDDSDQTENGGTSGKNPKTPAK